MNQALKNCLMVGIKSKLELQVVLGRITYCRRACIESFIALPKIHVEILYALKIFFYVHIHNEYAKEKNTTDWFKFHKVLLGKVVSIGLVYLMIVSDFSNAH